tara:strand:- start:1939 stop:2133 length:195 start_codon:yes stop_codon:yes gene_type:complete
MGVMDEKPFLNMDIGIKEVRLIYESIELYAGEKASTMHPSEKERLTKLRNLFYKVKMEYEYLNN